MADPLVGIRARRAEIEHELESRGLLHTFSAARFQLHRTLRTAIADHAFGNALEAGAGRSPFKADLEARVDSVTTLDMDPERAPDIVGDVQAMNDLSAASFDTVLCTQVLEHVPDPPRAVAELHRVLRPGGVLILSAPHLSLIHEAPNDFFRFTSFGFQRLCETSGLEVVRISPVGGLLSFIGHVLSSAWMSLIGTLPGLFWPAWAINYVLLVRALELLDRAMPGSNVLPRDYVVTARRPET